MHTIFKSGSNDSKVEKVLKEGTVVIMDTRCGNEKCRKIPNLDKKNNIKLSRCQEEWGISPPFALKKLFMRGKRRIPRIWWEPKISASFQSTMCPSQPSCTYSSMHQLQTSQCNIAYLIRLECQNSNFTKNWTKYWFSLDIWDTQRLYSHYAKGEIEDPSHKSNNILFWL